MDSTLDELREAIRQALESASLLDDQMRQTMESLAEEGKLDELIDKLLQRLQQENFISTESPQIRRQPGAASRRNRAAPRRGSL